MHYLTVVTVVVGLLSLVSCDSALAPTTSSVDLTGTFSGVGSDSLSELGYEMTWNLTQSGQRVDGSLLFISLSGLISATGTVSGALDGDTLTFEVVIPVGGSPQKPSCSSTATGTATVSNTVIKATYSGTNTCDGDYTDGRLTLYRR